MQQIDIALIAPSPHFERNCDGQPAFSFSEFEDFRTSLPPLVARRRNMTGRILNPPLEPWNNGPPLRPLFLEVIT